jgi:hypothetical protein
VAAIYRLQSTNGASPSLGSPAGVLSWFFRGVGAQS